MNSQRDNTGKAMDDASQILNQCELCNKKLANLFELNYHMKSEHSMGSEDIKTKEKKVGTFPCQHCGKSYSNSSNRRRHMLRCSLGEDTGTSLVRKV